MRLAYFFIVVLHLFFWRANPSQAQVDRSKLPKAGPPPEVKLDEYEKIVLKNGLTLILVENHKLPRVTFSLFFANPPIPETDKVGLSAITGELLRNGTKKMAKEELDEAIDFMGASLATSASGIYGQTLSKHTAKLLELIADVMLTPAFPQEAFDKIIKQRYSSLQAAKNHPNRIANRVADVLVYGKNHPYGEIVTEESLNAITLEDCKTYHETFFRPTHAYLAVVGDIQKNKIKRLVKRYFGQWKKALLPNFEYETPTQPPTNKVAFVDRPHAVQSVIKVVYPLQLKPTSTDLIAAKLLNQILGSASGRLYMNLREQHGFTYGAYSHITDSPYIGKFSASAAVRNEIADSAVAEILLEMKKIVHDKVGNDELQLAKNQMIGNFINSLEAPEMLASLAIHMDRFGLPKNYYKNYPSEINAITLDAIQQAAKKYIYPDNAYLLVVGKGEGLADKLSEFGAITYFDEDGNALQ